MKSPAKIYNEVYWKTLPHHVKGNDRVEREREALQAVADYYRKIGRRDRDDEIKSLEETIDELRQEIEELGER